MKKRKKNVGKSCLKVNKSLSLDTEHSGFTKQLHCLLIKQERKVGVFGHTARCICSTGFSWQQEVDVRAQRTKR